MNYMYSNRLVASEFFFIIISIEVSLHSFMTVHVLMMPANKSNLYMLT